MASPDQHTGATWQAGDTFRDVDPYSRPTQTVSGPHEVRNEFRTPDPNELIAPVEPPTVPQPEVNVQPTTPLPQTPTSVNAVSTPVTTQPATTQKVRPPRRWDIRDWGAALVLVVASFTLVGMHILQYTQLSPNDELQHLDYAYSASEGNIPREGHQIGTPAMREAACRGIDRDDYQPPPCDSTTYQPEQFPGGGVDDALDNSPLYYVVTGYAASALERTVVFDSFVVPARLMGAIWMGLGFTILWYVFAVIGVQRVRRAAIMSVFIATPLVLFNAATVGPQSTWLFLGSLVVLGAVKVAASEWSPWWLIPLAGFVLAVDSTITLLLVVAMIFLIVDVARYGRGAVGWLIPAVIAIAAIAVRWRLGADLVHAIWPARATPTQPTDATDVAASASPSVVAERPVGDPTVQTFVEQVPAMFTPIDGAYLPGFLRQPAVVLMLNLSNWLTIALAGVMALIGRSQARLTVLARMVLATCLIAGPLYLVYYWAFAEPIAEVPGRLGLPLVAALIVIAGAAIQNRFATIVATSVGGLTIAVMSFYLLV